MNDIDNSQCSPPCENIDIYCKRILAKKTLISETLLFNAYEGKVVPIDICIVEAQCPAVFEAQVAELLKNEGDKLQDLVENDAPTDILLDQNEKLAEIICSLHPGENRKVKCIEKMKVILCDLHEDIICNHKVILMIKFKVFLFVKFTDGKFGSIILPEDQGTKFCFGSDVHFPIAFAKDDIKELLNIDSNGECFILTIEIPLKKFDNSLPVWAFDDPTLQSAILIKNLKSDFDVGNTCRCDCTTGTRVSLIVNADITDKIGIDQDILICGTIEG